MEKKRISMRIQSEAVPFVLVRSKVLIGDRPQATAGVIGRKESIPTTGLHENIYKGGH